MLEMELKFNVKKLKTKFYRWYTFLFYKLIGYLNFGQYFIEQLCFIPETTEYSFLIGTERKA